MKPCWVLTGPQIAFNRAHNALVSQARLICSADETKQTSMQASIHMHVCNAVTLVWGLSQACPKHCNNVSPLIPHMVIMDAWWTCFQYYLMTSCEFIYTNNVKLKRTVSSQHAVVVIANSSAAIILTGLRILPQILEALYQIFYIAKSRK